MNTKLLMTISAFFLGVCGITLSFIPQEVSQFLNLPASPAIVLQISGALYLGLAMLNWTAKANLMGGIYSRPVAISNFTHFLIGGLALIKMALNNTQLPFIWVCAILYLIFATAFGYVVFNSPAPHKKA